MNVHTIARVFRRECAFAVPQDCMHFVTGEGQGRGFLCDGRLDAGGALRADEDDPSRLAQLR